MYKIINRKKLFVTALLDTFGKVLFFPQVLLRKKEHIRPEQVKTICLIRTAYIGDMVMTLPMIDPLRKLYPHAAITVLTSSAFAPLLEQNPHIAGVLTFDPFWFYRAGIKNWLFFIRQLRARSFDLVIETRGDIRELALLVFWMRARYKVSYDIGGGGYLLTHIVPYPGISHKKDVHLNMVRYLGGSVQEPEDVIYFTQDERYAFKQLLAQHGVRSKFIAVHPGSRVPLKQWSVRRYAYLCDLLVQRTGNLIILLGTRKEEPLLTRLKDLATEELISLGGDLGIRELAGVLQAAELFICNDSGPMHIASAVNTATVAVFGPSKSRETAPWSTHCRVVERDFTCRYSCDESHCTATEYHGCMKAVQVDDVLDAAEQLLEYTLD